MIDSDTLRLMLDLLPDTVLLCDGDGLIRCCNDQCEELLAWAPDELVGLPVETLLPHAQRQAHIAWRLSYVRSPRRRGMNQLQEIQALRKDGRLQPVSIALSPVDTDAGRMTIVSIRDNSAAVAARRKEQEMYERLLQKQRMENLGMLSSGIAHDFRNVLSVILGSAELALLELNDMHSGLSSYLQAIQTSSTHLKDLSGQILRYAAGRESRPQLVNLNQAAEEVALLLQGTLTPDTRLHCEPERGLPLLRADPGQIFQVLLNLILNAKDALGPAGGNITVRTGMEDGYVFVQIQDDGRGIAENERERLLEPFYTTKKGGKGLGLSVVNDIVQAHGGRLRIASEPGRGALFTVLFPGQMQSSELDTE
ncbi:MAG: two-component system sensor histidine kinase NtrB [Gammaproteobacteria bacterium]